MLNKQSVAAVILAGGAGNRMSGADKGLERYKGRHLVTSVHTAISTQVADLVVCANRNIEQYESLGYRVVSDRDPSQSQGPLAGVVAAIDYYQHAANMRALLVSPCDTPELPQGLLDRLIQGLTQGLTQRPTLGHLPAVERVSTPETSHQCAVVHDGDRQHSLHFLLPRTQWSSLRDFVDEGGRAAHRWHKKTGSIEVDFSDQAGQFININRVEELLP